MDKKVMVLEISNATDEEIQLGLGKAFNDFCNEYEGAGITASILEDEAASKVIGYINKEAHNG